MSGLFPKRACAPSKPAGRRWLLFAFVVNILSVAPPAVSEIGSPGPADARPTLSQGKDYHENTTFAEPVRDFGLYLHLPDLVGHRPANERRFMESRSGFGSSDWIGVVAAGPALHAQLATRVSDPGQAGKLTLAGIDANNNQVRDDVETYIELTVQDSARHREALKGLAVAIQHALLSQNKVEAVQAGTAEVRSIECLTYLGKKKENRWKDILARMLNTEQRIRAFDTYNDRVSGEVFAALPDGQYRAACNFDVEALAN